MLAILSSIESFYVFSADSIHYGAIVSCSHLFDIVLSDVLLADWYFIDYDIPGFSRYFSYFISYMYEFPMMWIILIADKLLLIKMIMLHLLFPFFYLLYFLYDATKKFIVIS